MKNSKKQRAIENLITIISEVNKAETNNDLWCIAGDVFKGIDEKLFSKTQIKIMNDAINFKTKQIKNRKFFENVTKTAIYHEA